MRKPLHDIEQTERFLFHQLTEEERSRFSLRLLTEPELYEQTILQQCSYRLIRYNARFERKQQLERIHTHLMQDPQFNSLLQQIFS